MAMICTGCGNSQSIEQLRADGFLSCCPERRMVDGLGLVQALEAIRDQAYSPRDDDCIWMDDATPVGQFIDRALSPSSGEAATPDRTAFKGELVGLLRKHCFCNISDQVSGIEAAADAVLDMLAH